MKKILIMPQLWWNACDLKIFLTALTVFNRGNTEEYNDN